MAGTVPPLWFFAQGKGPSAGTTVSITHLRVLPCTPILRTPRCSDGLPPVICNFLESCQARPGHLCK